MSFNWLTLQRASLATLALTAAVSIGVLCVETVGVLHESRAALAEFRLLASSSRPEFLELVHQLKITSFEVKSASKALKEEATDPGAISERNRVFRSTNAILGQTAVALDQFNSKTLPALTATINQSRALVENTDTSLNIRLSPAIERAVNSSNTTLLTLNTRIQQLADSGVITLNDAHALLSDPNWKEIAENLVVSSDNLVSTSQNVTAGTEYLKDAAQSTSHIASDIREYTKATSKARKVILELQIVSALTPIWAFLR